MEKPRGIYLHCILSVESYIVYTWVLAQPRCFAMLTLMRLVSESLLESSGDCLCGLLKRMDGLLATWTPSFVEAWGIP